VDDDRHTGRPPSLRQGLGWERDKTSTVTVVGGDGGSGLATGINGASVDRAAAARSRLTPTAQPAPFRRLAAAREAHPAAGTRAARWPAGVQPATLTVSSSRAAGTGAVTSAPLGICVRHGARRLHAGIPIGTM